MSDAQTMSGTPQTLALQPTMDLPHATELTKSLLGMRGQDLMIDASAVVRAGAPCIQVLLSAVRTWQADNKLLRISAASEEFLESLRLLGLRAAFPIEEPSL